MFGIDLFACRWDIPALILLVLVVVFFIYQKYKQKSDMRVLEKAFKNN